MTREGVTGPQTQPPGLSLNGKSNSVAARAPRWPIAFLSMASLLSFSVAWAIDHRMLFDDPLITLTFAKNLARGDGFIFNHAPPVLGTTTPLFAVSLAALAVVLPVPLTALAVAVSAACWAGISWLLFVFRREFSISAWQAVFAAYAILATGWIESLGMETYPFLLLLVLSVGLYWKKWHLACGVVLALLFLCRGEGILLFFILIVASIVSRHAPSLAEKVLGGPVDPKAFGKLGLGFVVPTALWCAYAIPTFGAALPHTLNAKRIQGASGLWPTFFDELTGAWVHDWGSALAIPGHPWIGLWTVGLVLGIREIAVRHSPLRILVYWCAVYVAGYTVLGVAAYHWYGRPVQFVFVIVFVLGFTALVRWTKDRFASMAASNALAAVISAVVIGRLAMAIPGAIAMQRTEPRSIVYAEMSRWIAANTKPDESIAALEVGCLGYNTDNRVIDLVGLVTPDVLKGVRRWNFAEGFWRHNPDLLVYLPGAWMYFRPIVADAKFQRDYEPVLHLKRAHFTVVLFRRNRAMAEAAP